MKLRLRVALVLLVIVMPVLTSFTVWRLVVERRTMLERHAERVSARLSERPPERCLRRPAEFQFQRRGVRGYGYDASFTSRNARAPEFPLALRRVASSEDPVHTHWWKGEDLGATAVPTGADGDCAYVLLIWSRDLPQPAIAGPVFAQSTILALALVLTSFLIAAPLVRRIRRLQQTVEGANVESLEFGDAVKQQDEIGDLARAFQDAGLRIRETIQALRMRDEALTEFVSNTTHDLAIPLTVLQHRLLRARQELAPTDPAHAHVDAALQESHYIGALVKNMGVAARLERTEEVVLHRQDLVELVERVYSRHQPIAQSRHIDFNVAVPDGKVEVMCDSTLTEQALSNLVQNAVQYVPEGGHVSILLEEVGSVWTVVVMDDGPGVPESMLASLGTRGARSDDARNRNPGGQGFGLNITRRVCDAHGWRLVFENSHPGLMARIYLDRTEKP
jgi:signal transduction histidine kinase